MFEIYEVVVYRENFKVSLFRKVNDTLFASRQQCKDENNDVMQLLVKLLMNRLYGELKRKDLEEKFAFKSKFWMMNEYDGKRREVIGEYHMVITLFKWSMKKDWTMKLKN